jgi:hypothetical protein
VRTASAMATPSWVEVPRPSSSRRISDLGVADFRMVDVSESLCLGFCQLM